MTKLQKIIALYAVKNSTNENYSYMLDKKQQMLDIFKYMNHCRHKMFTSTRDELLITKVQCYTKDITSLKLK